MRGAEIALIYDDLQRPDTTGGYCLRALAGLAQVTHLRPSHIGDIPASCDLVLCIDDGLDFPFPAQPRPSAFWAIDTHLDFERALRRSRYFTRVFAAQKEGAARLRAHGIPHCEWLPLACDPLLHRRLEVER